MKHFNKCSTMIGSLLIMLAYTPSALALNGETPVGHGLQYLLDALLGTDGVILATLAIIGVGLLCLTHYLEWRRLIQTLVGIAIIFGSSSIVSSIVSLVH